MVPLTLILVTAIIFALAFLFSMLGLGGALLYVPLLKWFHFDLKTVAIPTALLLNGLTALSASISYLRARMVDVQGAIPLILTSTVGASVGALCTQYVPTDTLIILFSIGMIVAGGRMLFSTNRSEAQSLAPLKKRLIATAISGFFIGYIAGLLGVGGGFLIVPVLIALGYPTKRAAATSAFTVVFSSFSGFFTHALTGHFFLPLLLSASVAVIVASQLGAKVMREKMKAIWIKRLFGLVLIGTAGKLLWPLLH